MKISKKLFYLNLGLILTLVLLCAVNVIAVQREHAARAASAKAAQAAKSGEEVRYQLMQNRLHLSNYLLSGDGRELQAVEDGVVKLQNELRAAEENSLNEAQRASLTRLHDSEREWEDSFLRPVVAKRKDVDNGKATVAELQIFYLQENPNQWTRTAAGYLDEAETATARLVADQHMQDASAGNVTITVALVGTFLAILLGLGISYKTSRSITVPLEQLIKASREIGETGDLDHEIDSKRKDEIGELARSFSAMISYLKGMAATSEAIAGGNLTVEVKPLSPNDTLGHAFARMVEGLRSLVSSVRDSAAQVASGSNQVAGASDESARISVQASSAIDEVTSTMHEMSINVQNMVKNTQVQASSVSETSASIDQMVASIQRVADTAKVLLDISERSRLEVQNGIATMDKATDGLNRINRTIQVSGGIIDALGQRADDIGKIVGVIDDLAEQTNLLALNAAIEAARAGEHGLGFAVVAEEVRKLAEKSAQSTKEISELISSIQREARKAVENMEKSTGIVDEGLTMGNDLNLALKKISSVVTEVYKFAQEIGAATNEQSHGSSQIARATARLNEITCEINSAVEEQASGAQGVVKAMEKMRELVQRSTSGSTELAASAEQMSKMSRSLLETMDRFAIDGHGHPSGGNGSKRPKKREEEYVPASRYAAMARS
ncbi:MAG TPA: methyl-accepting chemotaxis protein [Terriglobales bacterium]